MAFRASVKLAQRVWSDLILSVSRTLISWEDTARQSLIIRFRDSSLVVTLSIAVLQDSRSIIIVLSSLVLSVEPSSDEAISRVSVTSFHAKSTNWTRLLATPSAVKGSMVHVKITGSLNAAWMPYLFGLDLKVWCQERKLDKRGEMDGPADGRAPNALGCGPVYGWAEIPAYRRPPIH